MVDQACEQAYKNNIKSTSLKKIHKQDKQADIKKNYKPTTV